MKRSSIHIVALTGCLGCLALAAEEPLPWHVQDAEIRIPVTVSLEEAMVWMPPQVYLADLTPLETKGLAFDRNTKGVVTSDIRTKEQKENIIADLKRKCAASGQEYKPELYQPDLRANGSATFEMKPEYKRFSFHEGGGVQVLVDDKNIAPDKNIVQRQSCKMFTLPPAAKKFTITANVRDLGQAGFITCGPTVAEATLCLPGLDPTELIPLVYDLSGRNVGCRILWTYPGEPMSILFDCSSGDKQYLVYLVPRSKQPPRLDWAPRAGLMLESRYPDRYDPAPTTLEGFMKLWDGTDFIAGKKVVRDTLWRWYHATYTSVIPGAAISHCFVPFRPRDVEATNFRDGIKTRRASLVLSRYTGFFHIPETQDYEFYFGVQPAGYLLIDDQVVSEWRYGEAGQADLKPLFAQGKGQGGPPMKAFRLKLEKGLHKLDFCLYGSRKDFSAWFCWRLPDNERSTRAFGREFSVWEPLADAAAGAMTHREEKLCASFSWRYAGKEWLGNYPAGDIIQYSLAGALSEEREDAVFRWRFDDGHTAEGREIKHLFFAPGNRKVELEVLDGPNGKTIAHKAGNIHVQVDWSEPNDDPPLELLEPITQRETEFASGTPIRDVFSLYYWSLECDLLEQRRSAIGRALAERIDEVIAKYPYDSLLDLARTVPMAAHFPAVEKLCKAVMDRAHVGSRHWKSAATTLAESLVAVCGEPQKALQLLETAEKAAPSLDLTGAWCIAAAKQWYPSIPESGEIAGVTEGLKWSKASDLPVKVHRAGGQGAWIAKEFHMPESRQGKELVLELGRMSGHGMTIWFNGSRLGTSAQCPNGNIVIPAEMQRFGETNRFLALHQPAEPPEWFGVKRGENYGFAGPAAEKDDPAKRVTADALLMMGEEEKAKEILLQLKPDAWPLGEETQLQLSADLRRIQRLAAGCAAEADIALSLLDKWLGKHPLLRTVPGVMIVKLETFAGLGDAARALTLAKQMLRMGLNGSQREQVMLVQVRAMCKARKMDDARDVYIQLKKIAPYSPATVEAREAITKTVLGKDAPSQ